MDLLFDLEAVQKGVDAYDRMVPDTVLILEAVKALTDGIEQKTWSGDGREAFQMALEIWKKRTEVVLADMKKTQESLVEYAANKALDLKETCESFGEVFD